MAEAESQKSTTTTTRRSSFKRSLLDCDLSPQYLETLEQKRKSLDDSIHKYIASKEREYKQFEKELRSQARLEGQHKHAQQPQQQQQQQQQADVVKASSPPEAVKALLRPDSRSKLHDSTEQADFAGGQDECAIPHDSAKSREGFLGVFTPEYLAALEHERKERTLSEPPAGLVNNKPISPLVRANSDSIAQASPHRPARLMLSHRTSSSGSSVDGRLISALKSPTEASKAKGKRVSLAVGDSIVAPSDSVPVALSINSTSSHSRQRAANRERQALYDVTSNPSQMSSRRVVSPLENNNAVSGVVETLREQSSASAATALVMSRIIPIAQQREDIGDMFDLEDEELHGVYNAAYPGSSPDDQLSNEVVGRVNSTSPVKTDDTLNDIEPGEPPPTDSEDDKESAGMIFTKGIAASKQPLSPGFRRPSAILDPTATTKDHKTSEATSEDSSYYGSSYSRSSKGSFTSSSLGESYMAKNAEKLIEMRSQQHQHMTVR